MSNKLKQSNYNNKIAAAERVVAEHQAKIGALEDERVKAEEDRAKVAQLIADKAAERQAISYAALANAC